MATASLPRQLPREVGVGDTFATAARTVTETDIVSFATQTGDLHPLHVNAEWAAASGFGERIAPGALVLSYAIGLVQLDPSLAMALRGIDDVVFIRPVKIGDTLSASCRVSSVAPGDRGPGTVTLTVSVSNQRRKPVCRARLRIMWDGELAEGEANQGGSG